MAPRKQTRSSNRTRQTRTPIANRATASVRKLSKPPLTEPFHVAVDRQLKSGHETYEAAEQAALGIKKRYPKLLVTVFDAKEQRHTLIEQPKLARCPQQQSACPASNPERRCAAQGRCCWRQALTADD